VGLPRRLKHLAVGRGARMVKQNDNMPVMSESPGHDRRSKRQPLRRSRSTVSWPGPYSRDHLFRL